ncbi:hypothetical protein HanIR_Chr09g0444471 [Helianthus annuus]|nr:hypothetical protein HanIR_Chr09g0444471 [Helianthus annuus]
MLPLHLFLLSCFHFRSNQLLIFDLCVQMASSHLNLQSDGIFFRLRNWDGGGWDDAVVGVVGVDDDESLKFRDAILVQRCDFSSEWRW